MRGHVADTKDTALAKEVVIGDGGGGGLKEKECYQREREDDR